MAKVTAMKVQATDFTRLLPRLKHFLKSVLSMG